MSTNAAYYKTVSEDTALLLSLDQVKQHLFIGEDDSADDLINVYIGTAQELVSDWINQPLQPTVVNAYYSQLDPSGLVAPHPFITGVVLQYFNTAGTVSTIPAANYAIDTTAGLPRIYSPTGSYPIDGLLANPVSISISNPVFLNYTAQLEEVAQTGERSSQRVRQAMLMYITDLWNRRGDEENTSQNISQTTVLTARRLLRKYRQPTL